MKTSLELFKEFYGSLSETNKNRIKITIQETIHNNHWKKYRTIIDIYFVRLVFITETGELLYIVPRYYKEKE